MSELGTLFDPDDGAGLGAPDPARTINGPVKLLETIAGLGYSVTIVSLPAGLVRLEAHEPNPDPAIHPSQAWRFVTSVQAETLQDAVFILGYDLYQLRRVRDAGHTDMVEDVLEAAALAGAESHRFAGGGEWCMVCGRHRRFAGHEQ